MGENLALMSEISNTSNFEKKKKNLQSTPPVGEATLDFLGFIGGADCQVYMDAQ